MVDVISHVKRAIPTSGHGIRAVEALAPYVEPVKVQRHMADGHLAMEAANQFLVPYYKFDGGFRVELGLLCGVAGRCLHHCIRENVKITYVYVTVYRS